MPRARSKPVEDQTQALARYARETRRPIVSLLFLLPIIGLYEIGVWWWGAASLRNGADVLMRSGLESAGLGFAMMLPLLTCAILIIWHHLSGDRWRVHGGSLVLMAGECALLAVALWGIAQLHHQVWLGSEVTAQIVADGADPAIDASTPSPIQAWVGYLGAGIYEELLFRLILLTVIVWLLASCVQRQRRRWGIALTLSSLLFVAAHYQPLNAGGYPLQWSDIECVHGISFRCLAGFYFGWLFLYRGFGVAVGTHALYDIFAHSI